MGIGFHLDDVDEAYFSEKLGYEMPREPKFYESTSATSVSSLPKTKCNIPMPPVKPPASNGDRICDTCNKEDVCMYKEELSKAIKDIAEISDRTNVFIDTDIKCKKWSGVVSNYR